MELVKQGWLVRGNMRFASDAEAAELIASVQQLQQRIADSRAIQLVIGKPIAHVIANLAFARTGPRVSYATSISIADARALLAAAAQQLDQYFRQFPGQPLINPRFSPFSPRLSPPASPRVAPRDTSVATAQWFADEPPRGSVVGVE